ncbi:MAG: alpha/beta hydrolase [Amaricoccus sp.]|uniref:alpha/beta hydrolase n=1 Tax=Amaricoccus sp. TaxID=1872485 RepID=UPI0039E35C7B
MTLAIALYHPPMRLMPPPLLFQKGGAQVVGIAPEMFVGNRIDVLYATNRLPVGPRDARVYTVAPDRNLHFGTAHMRVGSEGTSFDDLVDWTTRNSDDRPFIHLEAMSETAALAPDDDPAEAADWFAAIDAALAATGARDLIVYVHGANTTVERAAGQAAQLQHFGAGRALVVLFAWPTAENFLRYPRDIETAFGGAPHLAELVRLLAAHTRAEKIDVFTYSAGGTVGSDGLARLAGDPGAAATRLGEVYHAAPDADFRAFATDLAAYGPIADRVTTAVNMNDSALRLAQLVNRASRAGRPDLRELSDDETATLLAASTGDRMQVVQVHPEAMDGLSARSHTFWYDDPWVSNDVLMTLLFHLTPGERGLVAGTSPQGVGYWTFPSDYTAHMPALVDLLRQRLPDAGRG